MTNKLRLVRTSMLLLLCSLTSVHPCHAQNNYTRTEFGVQYSTVELTSPSGGNHVSGFGGRFDWNFTRRLAFESQVDYWPESYEPLFGVQGGRTLQAVFGLRAKAIQTRHFAVFGVVRPGIFHFSNVEDYQSGSSVNIVTRPETHFVVNLGGGIEYYPSARWVFRADLEGNPYQIQNETRTIGGVPEFLPGKINDTTRFSVGVAYRPGAVIENEHESNVPGKWELGPLFSTMLIQREGATVGVRAEPGVGGYGSYHLYRVFYLDGELLYFPRGTDTSGPHDGGTIFQGTMGLKGGIRRNHFGIFGKVRPGFNSYSAAISSITTTPSNIVYGTSRANTFVLDLGGIIELYPAEHGTIRVEVGDTHLYFGSRTVSEDGMTQAVGGYPLEHSIQFTVGYGWRF